jgi:hypothetical protein
VEIEHQTTVFIAMLVGAAAGIVVGLATSHEPWSFVAGLTERASDAVAFAPVGAMVVVSSFRFVECGNARDARISVRRCGRPLGSSPAFEVASTVAFKTRPR